MRDCGCSGGSCSGRTRLELTRRAFLGHVAAGTAGAALASQLGWLQQPAQARSLIAQPWPDYPLTPVRIYRGAFREAVAMPIGGIGTGSIWLDGEGRLAVWQIFNNLNETRIPHSLFAVAARQGNGLPVVRALQTAQEDALPPMASLDYEGGYPVARLEFEDQELPVQITLEAFNPLIPLNTADSSIPCALFRFTARNTGPEPVDVRLLGSLQNAVGSRGDGGIEGVRFSGYGSNRNQVLRDAGHTILAMDQLPEPMVSGPVIVRDSKGAEVEGPELLWLTGVDHFSSQSADAMVGCTTQGGAVLLDGLTPGFWETVTLLRDKTSDVAEQMDLFADFEQASYEGWTIMGDAFGKRPSRGTEANQQQVSGFAGRGLVNTFIAGDGPQGKATSKPFRIERRYIGFLIGGGAHQKQTCINLRVGDQVVLSATGRNREELEAASWDVSQWKGQYATLEIVDAHSGAWGHINIDQIIFSDIPPELLLKQHTASGDAAQALAVSFAAAEPADLAAGQSLQVTGNCPPDLRQVIGQWKVTRFTRLRGFQEGAAGFHALVTTADGDPLVVEGPLGKGRLVLALAAGLPWSCGSALLAASRGKPLEAGQQLVPGHPGWGSMALTALSGQAEALVAWSEPEQLRAFLAGFGKGRGEVASAAPSPVGETRNGALAVPLHLAPGEQQTATFAITWHFPNVQRFQHTGNLYSRRWANAQEVARDLAAAPMRCGKAPACFAAPSTNRICPKSFWMRCRRRA